MGCQEGKTSLLQVSGARWRVYHISIISDNIQPGEKDCQNQFLSKNALEYSQEYHHLRYLPNTF